ncbi:putative lipid transport family protein [Monocercomonoides exilis]|uniref:putative lipid transport family protein n=1 Tax=Monocercomonoides exilis TaxID=2049356 RepID=UPI003559B539|nr:putative lipid transport family protein [Monocercomonoides exilis]|eukprot:MONOS_4084.1-p1 / transcript=MONOS_4084.1 / gene=MONOS_4084 / organism=Monocercomonoides_exilis_PA203 / gene_product=lipid transport family protein / transcript_product=lipid transport family protein / location=Mono_scaffold00104:24057-25727(+) / protein_length=556 / sequence_SO=supercontig / SO=protein_coding / is_pseudo=false
MLFFILNVLSLVSCSTLSYQKGASYVYNFNSDVAMTAQNVAGEEKFQGFAVEAQLTILCTNVVSNSFSMSMTAKNVKVFDNENGKRVEVKSRSGELDKVFSRPLLFSLSETGVVSNVKAHKDDTTDIVDLKVAIISALQTTMPQNENAQLQTVVDMDGKHYVHVDVEFSGASSVVTSSYTEQDFISFRDPNINKDKISLDGHDTTVISYGIINEITQLMSVTFSKKNVDADADEAGNLAVFSDGKTNLKLVSSRRGVPITAVDESEYVEVDILSDSLYTSQFEALAHVKPTPPEDCPYGVEFCKKYALNYWLGNTSIGINVGGSVVAGTNPGCHSETRNFLVGAYANLDLWILNSKLELASAYVEYGYVNGAAQRNALEVQVFSYSVYKKPFPDMPCIRKSIHVADLDKEFSYKYVVHVSVVPIKFSVGVRVQFDANVPYELCAQTWFASIAFEPYARVSAFAEVGTEILIAKGGLRLEANIDEKLDPTAYISAGQCKVGMYANSHTGPFSARFVGHVAFRTCTKGCKWGLDREYVFWQWQYKPIDIKIFDVSYQF